MKTRPIMVPVSNGFADFIDGSEADSGLCGLVTCPKCEGSHRPTISVIGRFLYDCQGAIISGAFNCTQPTENNHLPVDGEVVMVKGDRDARPVYVTARANAPRHYPARRRR